MLCSPCFSTLLSRVSRLLRQKVDCGWLKGKGTGSAELLAKDPFQNPPPYEKRVGELEGAYSRRMNIQHHLVYEAFKKERMVCVLRMWTHYE